MMADYYAQRAEAGLIVTESTQVSPQGRGYPGSPGIYRSIHIDGWTSVGEAVHARGGLIFLQLWHAGRLSHPLVQEDGQLPVAPSAIAPEGLTVTREGMKPFVTPRALSASEVAKVVEQFGEGAEKARRAGFDGVEINAANGYLIDQFLRDGSNRRTDSYGGSAQNRIRFLLEVTESVAAVFGPEHVGVRLSPTNPFGSMSDSHPAETFGCAVRSLSGYGLAYLHGREAGTSDFDWRVWRRQFPGAYVATAATISIGHRRRSHRASPTSSRSERSIWPIRIFSSASAAERPSMPRTKARSMAAAPADSLIIRLWRMPNQKPRLVITVYLTRLTKIEPKIAWSRHRGSNKGGPCP